MIPELTPEGDLPRGRFCASADEVKQRFVDDDAYETSTTRVDVWQNFLDLVALIQRKKVRVPAAFVGGSFLTSEPNPSDLDAALLIDMSRIQDPKKTYAEVVTIVSNPKADLGLKVDAFLIEWHPDGTQVGGNPNYPGQRGFWDDFWQRKVAKADRNPPQRSHSMPVRGYLEVIIDGYK